MTILPWHFTRFDFARVRSQQVTQRGKRRAGHIWSPEEAPFQPG